MKKTNITIVYDDEKLSALRIYLAQKQLTVEDELTASLDSLYTRTVPTNVRDFIQLRQGTSRSAYKSARSAQRNSAPDTTEPKRSENA